MISYKKNLDITNTDTLCRSTSNDKGKAIGICWDPASPRKDDIQAPSN